MSIIACGLIRPPQYDIHTKCNYLDYKDPYLKLGPFKYEIKNIDPHIGMFKDFYGEREMERILEYSRGRQRASEFFDGQARRLYTSQRVSKRFHIEDKQLKEARTWSKRISLATKWVIKQKNHHFDEHYHVINYGLGGLIQVHADYWGPDMNPHPGGDRIVTFLGYLSDVEAGGRTIFPQLGLTVDPEKGSALFWTTSKQNREFDSRMFHMGCPVLIGEKWVSTKWLYSHDQMWTHPCQKKSKTYNYLDFNNNNNQHFI